MNTFTTLPKVELHLHLDCSLSYKVVRRLDPAVTRAAYDRDFVAPARCTSLADFLTRAPKGFQLMQSRDSLRLVVEDLFAQLAADGVVYAEIRFAPLLHVFGGLGAVEVVEEVERATVAASRATGIEAGLILCTLRHYTREESTQTVHLVEQFAGSAVMALDIAGDEAGYPMDAHTPAFQHAIEHGLKRTAHAGEARGAASVWEVLRLAQPSRIGHGVRSIEDPSLVEHLRRTGIHLEVCPTSNVQTNVCGEYRDHPVDRLFRAGVSLSISTDTRTITNITLRQEYDKLHDTFGWDKAQFAACNRAAIDAAFAPDDVKARVLGRLNQ